MKRFFILYLAIFTVSLFAQNAPFTCLSDNSSKTEISFNTPAFHLESETRSNQTVHHLAFEDGRSLAGVRETGQPELPTFAKLIEIPELSRVEAVVEILEEEILTDIFLSPTPSLDEPTRDPLETVNNEIYSSNQLYPIVSVAVENPGIMRNHLVAQLQFNPIRYNPVTKELHIIKKANITLNYINDATGLRSTSQPTSSDFEKMVQSRVLNPGVTRDNPEPGSYLFVYDGNDNVKLTIDALAEWKHRKGYEVNFLNTESLESTSSQVRQAIRELYQTMDNPPEFICLVGNGYSSNQIPVFYDIVNGLSIEGDYPYTLLTGDDAYPDAVVGRLPFDSIFELQTVIAKIFSYEKNTDIEDDWLNNTILVGDASLSGSSTITTAKYVKDVISLNYPEMSYSEIYEEPFAAQISEAINSGSGAYFYRGFQGMSGWSPGDSQNMNHPFIHVGLTCNNAYLTSSSYMENVLLSGTPGTPIGMVAGIGSSNLTHTGFNNLMTGSIARSLYEYKIGNLGTALLNSKIELWNNFPNNPFSYLDWYNIVINLFGDPGMTVWNVTPVQANVTHPNELALGTNSVSIIVMDESGVPLENGWVTLLKDGEVFCSTYTSSSGEAVLTFDCQTIGDLKLTVTHPHLKPYLFDIPITAAENFIGVEEVTNLTDFQAGGSASFKLNLKNYGAEAGENVTATISCENELCEITQNSSDFPNIQPGIIVESNSIYQMNISPTCNAEDEFEFAISITSGGSIYNDIIRLSPSAPLLYLESYSSSASIIPGITTGISLNIGNLGTQTFAESNLIISSTSSYLEISDSTAVLSELTPGSTATSLEDDISINLSGSSLPGMTLPLQVQLTDQNGLVQTIEFEIVLETSSPNDPTGPDAYGYFCYDDGDTAYDMAPTYNWIELDPTYGGDGNVLDLEDNDVTGSGDMETITLLFPITLYGESYNQLSISSNGYVLPGIHETNDWMNWHIPGSMVPSPIIAPFWDDLLIVDSAVCWKYDETEHIIIVEWSRLHNRYDNSLETFQLLLTDPNFVSSNLGDSVIKFQYKEINNVDVGSYDGAIVYHGQYATVGIGNTHSTVGLEYTFCNQYPLTAKPLENEMALLFNGPDEQPEEASLLLANTTLLDENGNTNLIPDAGETIQFSPSIRNRGLETATNVSAALSCSSEFITITQATGDFSDIASNQIEEVNSPFSFEISENCPNNFIAILIFNVEFSGMTRELEYRMQISAPELLYSNFWMEEEVPDDGSLGSGENGIIHLNFLKSSYLEFENTNITLACSNPDVELSNNIQSFNSITEDTLLVDFDIYLPETITNGDSLNFSVNVTSGAYSANYEFSFMPLYYELLFQEDFTELNPEWTNFNGIIVNEGLAGGSGNEAHIIIGETYQHLTCEFTSDRIVKGLKFRFKYRQVNNACLVKLLVANTSWQGVWSNSITNETPQEAVAELIFREDQVTNNPIIYFYAYPGDSNQIFALDDFEVYAFYKPNTAISGHINLIGGTGDVTETSIAIGDYETNPDENGDYYLTSPPGVYNVQIKNEGYSTEAMYLNLEPNVAYTYDFNLEYLPPAENLSYQLEGANLELNWSYNETSNRKDIIEDRIDLTHFIIQFKVGALNLTETTTDTTFTRELPVPGDYEVYITAFYGNDDYSSVSDTLLFGWDTSAEDNEIPAVYQLAQNHPNPFNPTTTISFDLPNAASRCNLSIYNCKGQLVKNLVNEAKAAGSYSQVWNGKDAKGKQVSSGIYMYKLSTDVNKTVIKKMILLK